MNNSVKNIRIWFKPTCAENHKQYGSIVRGRQGHEHVIASGVTADDAHHICKRYNAFVGALKAKGV